MATFLVAGATLTGVLPASADETIRITDRVTPATLEVPIGTVVVWANDDGVRHRMRSQTGPTQFDSGNIDPGEQFSFTFSVAGSYTYIDDRNPANPAYHGTITVSAGGGGSGGGGGGTGGTVIRMVNRSFSPTSLTIAPGTTVSFPNDDTEDHTVTARDGSFDSGIYGPGQSYSRTFDTPGVFSFFCALHPDMVGSITVTQPDGSAPSTTTTTAPTAPPGTVQAFDFGYRPGTLTVAVGSTVTFTNTGVAPHTFTDRAGRFDSGWVSTGQAWTRTFDAAGTFEYFCTLHPQMVGTLVVQPAGGTAPPAPTPTTLPPPPPLGPQDVQAFDFGYTPGTLTVAVGSTVTFTNTGVAPHTFTDRAGRFDSGLLSNGGRWTKTFDTAGTFEYFCTLHPQMVGTLVVQPAGGTAPPAPAPTTTTTAPPAATGSAPSAGSGTVSMVDNAFSPARMTVRVGSTVTWVNNGAAVHTATAGGAFDSGLVSPGGRYSHRFDRAGTFPYVCIVHPGMAGTITVVDASGSAPPPAPTTSTTVVTELSGPPAVSIDGASLSPDVIEVSVGDSILWTNDGDNPAQLVATDGSFASTVIQPGETWTFTPEATGEVEYRNVLAADAALGRLIIVEAATTESVGRAGVTIVDLDYTPRDLSVTVGTEVTWTNVGQAPHTVTARDQSFDSGILQNTNTWSFVFGTEGTFEYFCTLHPDMIGTVRVLPADASATDLAAASNPPGGILPPELPTEPAPEPAGKAARTVIQVIAVIAFAGTTVALFRVGKLVLGSGHAT